MGDFDTLSASKEIGVLRAAGFRDEYEEVGDQPGYTWDGTRNANILLQRRTYPEDFWLEPVRKRIDYIFYRGPCLEVRASRVVLDRPVWGIYPSDHFGVLADFAICRPN